MKHEDEEEEEEEEEKRINEELKEKVLSKESH